MAQQPGLKVVIPSSPYDAKGLLISAIRDNDPVIFLEHMKLYRSFRQEVPEGEYTIPLGKAEVKREGTDLTIVTYGAMVHESIKAAEELEKEGHSVEVIDLRTISPLDIETIIASVEKTNRVIVVQEARTGPRRPGSAPRSAAQPIEWPLRCGRGRCPGPPAGAPASPRPRGASAARAAAAAREPAATSRKSTTAAPATASPAATAPPRAGQDQRRQRRVGDDEAARHQDQNDDHQRHPGGRLVGRWPGAVGSADRLDQAVDAGPDGAVGVAGANPGDHVLVDDPGGEQVGDAILEAVAHLDPQAVVILEDEQHQAVVDPLAPHLPALERLDRPVLDRNAAGGLVDRRRSSGGRCLGVGRPRRLRRARRRRGRQKSRRDRSRTPVGGGPGSGSRRARRREDAASSDRRDHDQPRARRPAWRAQRMATASELNVRRGGRAGLRLEVRLLRERLPKSAGDQHASESVLRARVDSPARPR